MGQLLEVRVPAEVDQANVLEVLVQAGATVALDQGLVGLESDKASFEVPAPAAGTVREVKVKPGDPVAADTLLLVLEVMAAPTATAPTATAPAATAPTATAPTATASTASPASTAPPTEPAAPASAPPARPEPGPTVPSAEGSAHAGPAVRRFARELGVDLTQVRGSGRKGRILKEDVQTHVQQRLAGGVAGGSGVSGFAWPQMPEIDFAKFGPIEVKPLNRIRRVAAHNLHRSWLHVPHVTQHEEADITELEAFRQEHAEEAKARGAKLTLLAFLLKATVGALKAYPELNAALDASGENLILKHYFHLGVAVDTPNGLVVPVLRDVDRKGVYELAQELAATSARAREGKLTPQDFQGSCFTISSLGGIGGTAFTPIVNAPEVAILGVSRAKTAPVWSNGTWVPRLLLPLSLSYDHRVVDGALGARFIVHLRGLLEDLRRLLL